MQKNGNYPVLTVGAKVVSKRMAISVTASHYDWAMKKIKQYLKMVK